ncbi:type IV secretory system conjugative DNA transfer family protein [Kitasatospora sp. NPDC052868]|uniref:type IV secretory system conjugative DNA transfer family protein n=1 Tax=Kitasatospora sp. NPDC052868 TaxID=3364060 RepID=UPI0037CBC0A1
MTTDHTPAQADTAIVRSPAAEKAFATGQVLAPLLTAAVMPLLEPQAAATVATFLAAPALVAGANFSGLLSAHVLDAVPGGDILRAHRLPFLVSTVTTATAAAAVTLHGATGVDSLVAGFMTMPSMAGMVSTAWWGASGFVAFSLRRVLRSSRPRRHAAAPHPQSAPEPAEPTPVDRVLQLWHAHISGEYGVHPGQHLTLTGHGPEAWEGTIEAAPGRPVTVTRDTVSGVYRLPATQIRITAGPHDSSRHITVHLVAPSVEEVQHGELEALWLQRVARQGGCVPGTHLEGAIADPATGGVAAWVVADEDTDTVTVPAPYRLAGALRTTMLLVSFEPTNNPRKAILRKMERSPLENGTPLPGPGALVANKNGFVQLGTGVSGRPARIQLYDPKAGAQHVLIAGVTGSGKGGVIQLLCLSYHVNGFAIIYADPKGSSNPDVEDMAAYAGCGLDEAMGALRLAYAILLHRVAQSKATRAKNFVPSPGTPWVALVIDEFAQLLGDKSPHRAEAALIVAAYASLARSLGMALVLCGQIMNLDQMGCATAIRDNVYYGGALVLLRSDGAQKHRVDLPPNFDGIDPAQIPAYWKGDDESLVYDPTIPEDDPRRTFGVAYIAGPDGRPEMMRAWILESAAGQFDPERICVPADFPGWDDREAIAATVVGPDALAGTEGAAAAWAPSAPALVLAKEPTAREKILLVLEERRDPIGLDINYLHIDQITAMAGVARSTTENRLSELVKDGTVVRHPETKGEYGLPLPPDSAVTGG